MREKKARLSPVREIGQDDLPTIAIDPRKLSHRLRLGNAPKPAGLLVWDEPSRVLHIERDPEVLRLRDLVEARGVPAHSPFHVRSVELARKGAILVVNDVALTTEADMLWCFGQYHRLAESIATRGIVAISDLATESTAGVGLHDGDAPDYPGIAIWKDGALLWFGEGRHRVTIAQCLDVSPIRVSLRVVNRHWLSGHESADDGRAAIRELLDDADQRGQPEERQAAQRWLSSVDRSVDHPTSREDPHGINKAVSEGLLAHNRGRFEEAHTIWSRLGEAGQVPPYVNVLAAATAIGVGDLGDAALRLGEVLADQPTHIAANMAGADLALASDDVGAELDHLEVAFSQDPIDRRVGLRFVRRLIRADRLDRADEVIDQLSPQDFDEATLENLEHLRRRSHTRRTYLSERDSARQARIAERERAREARLKERESARRARIAERERAREARLKEREP